MPTEPSKYAENQFDSATADNYALMSEVLVDTIPRIIAAAITQVGLAPARDLLISTKTAWDTIETTLANAEANQLGATFAFEDKLRSLTRQPNADTNSPIEAWDLIIGGQTAFGSALYKTLLPRGRETITTGTYVQQLDAIHDFSLRLAAQATKPALVLLGSSVLSFHTAALALRNAQLTIKTNVDNARTDQEGVRKLCAAALYGMVGLGQWVFRATPLLVDTLFDVNILRQPAQSIPTAPGLPVWAAAARTLTVAAMPTGATRLEAWREGPGGMPELLIVGERDALSATIPANITFDAGDSYQLWLQSRNSRGSSGPGAKVTWVAVP